MATASSATGRPRRVASAPNRLGPTMNPVAMNMMARAKPVVGRSWKTCWLQIITKANPVVKNHPGRGRLRTEASLPAAGSSTLHAAAAAARPTAENAHHTARHRSPAPTRDLCLMCTAALPCGQYCRMTGTACVCTRKADIRRNRVPKMHPGQKVILAMIEVASFGHRPVRACPDTRTVSATNSVLKAPARFCSSDGAGMREFNDYSPTLAAISQGGVRHA